MTNQQIYYLTNFSMFSKADIEIFCSYKQFVEATIIELGQDWRVESGLLFQQIVNANNNKEMDQQKQKDGQDRTQFNIFNYFLQAFLKDKIGKEIQCKSEIDAVPPEHFAERLSSNFVLNPQIGDSLTFKTLSLGFNIKAIDMWGKSFYASKESDQIQCNLAPLGILSKIKNNDQNMDETKSSKKWTSLQDLSIFSSQQIQGIIHSLKKTKSLKIQVISNFAVNIHQINVNGKKIRLLSVSSDYYRVAFIVWLIFNIKLFFSITFEQYLSYFKNLLVNWQPNFEGPLKKFYTVMERQWSTLLKDYSVALHDDLQVLKSLIFRVKNTLSESWKSKRQQICKKMGH